MVARGAAGVALRGVSYALPATFVCVGVCVGVCVSADRQERRSDLAGPIPEGRHSPCSVAPTPQALHTAGSRAPDLARRCPEEKITTDTPLGELCR